jgi:AcrR family transcriptional regulator
MVLFLQKAMAEGRSRGYAATRAVGFMEWAVDQVAGVDDVVSYETDLDNALRGAADSVICAYDLSRHSAGLVARLQTAHPLAIIGGRLVPTGARGASPRERLLDAASQLFSSQGIGPTGVDALIDAAGVAKATFYSYFPSKDDLIVAWLGDGRTRWLDRVRRRAKEIAGESVETIPAFFEAVAEWLEAENCRGCPYLNTAVELVDAGHPAQQMIDDYLSEERTYLQDLLLSAPHRAPTTHGGAARLAAELQLLLTGAISLSVARRDSSPARQARDAAIRLVGSAISERP